MERKSIHVWHTHLVHSTEKDVCVHVTIALILVNKSIKAFNKYKVESIEIK